MSLHILTRRLRVCTVTPWIHRQTRLLSLVTYCFAVIALSLPTNLAAATIDIDSATIRARYKDQQPHLWGERLPGIIRTLPTNDSTTKRMALTLDACGGRRGSSFDASIIALLRREQIPATIFVTSIWLRNNTAIAKELAEDPLFELAAHGKRHKPASVNGRSAYDIKGTRSVPDLIDEVDGNARDIEQLTGKRPKWYRSGTAYYDEVAVAVIGDLEMRVAGFSITADEGATLPASAVAKQVLRAKNTDIILCHLNHPESGTGKGLAHALPQLKAAGFQFVKLSDAMPVVR